MEEVEVQANEEEILEDIAKRLDDVALEALNWDGIVDILDGIIWDNILFTVEISQATVLLQLRAGFSCHVELFAHGRGETRGGD